jgi:hypothetical protein
MPRAGVLAPLRKSLQRRVWKAILLSLLDERGRECDHGGSPASAALQAPPQHSFASWLRFFCRKPTFHLELGQAIERPELLLARWHQVVAVFISGVVFANVSRTGSRKPCAEESLRAPREYCIWHEVNGSGDPQELIALETFEAGDATSVVSLDANGSTELPIG